MTTAPNRKLTPISIEAHRHMERIIAAYRKRGLRPTNTGWLSEMILSQPVPNGNHTKPAPSTAVAEVTEEEK